MYPSETVLKLSNITKSFGGIKALKGVDFELRHGEVHALLGENGAGKSTLIKVITGVHAADGGEIILNGKAVTIADTIDARHKGIAAIYQELSLIDSLTVAENIFLGNEPTLTALKIYDRKTLYQRSAEYLEKFGIDIDSHKLVSELGMGQKRIVEIVKALAVDAQILLLDEPTTGMSKAEIDILFKIMENLKNKGVTMIYISHYLDEVFRVCDRATVLRDGQHILTSEINQLTPDSLVKAMVGKDVHKNNHISRDVSDKSCVLELRDFQSSIMRGKVSLQVHHGEIVGVTGIVGAGKSELAHSIFGNAKKVCGDLIVNGKQANFSSPYDTKSFNIAFIPEDRKKEGLFLSDTMADNTAIVNLKQIKTVLGLLSGKKKNELGKKMAENLHLSPPIPEMKASNFSGGNQQKIVLAKWLARNPDLIIMDEPTRGIDVGAKNEIYSLIEKLAKNDKGVLVMSSEFDELIELCDRIYVLRRGELVGELCSGDITYEKILALALGG